MAKVRGGKGREDKWERGRGERRVWRVEGMEAKTKANFRTYGMVTRGLSAHFRFINPRAWGG